MNGVKMGLKSSPTRYTWVGERGEKYITVMNGVKMGLKSSSTRYTWVGGERGEIYYCHERGEEGTEELLY